MQKRLFMDIHVLRTLPPSCVNRDDVGRPKTAIYGGTQRARISSQAEKHAVRKEIRRMFPDYSMGVRTRHVRDLLANNIMALDSSIDEEKAYAKAKKALEKLGLKEEKKENEEENKDKKDKDESLLLFVTHRQLQGLAEVIVGGKMTKTKLEEALTGYPSIDMILFGRMIAGKPYLNYDATVQVAHSISTHTVDIDYDYFSAVDDVDPSGGAAHLGTSEFNSATMYRFATMNISEFWKHEEYRTAEAAIAFAKAFTCAMPKGKINAYANFTLPDDVYIAIRSDQPVNLCGAFERPVKCSKDGGYVKESESAFNAYAKDVYSNIIGAPLAAFGSGRGTEELIETKPLPQVFDDLQAYLEEILRSAQ